MRSTALLAAGLLLLPAAAQAQQAGGPVDVPIVIGGTGSVFNACDEGGNIVGLDPHGDGFLSVRSGPGGRQFREIDRLYNGMHVKICDERGSWLGVVYSPTGEHDGCNVEHEWRTRMAYTGPCRYGWVFSRYVGDRANRAAHPGLTASRRAAAARRMSKFLIRCRQLKVHSAPFE